MSTTLDNRIAQANERAARAELQHRLRQRRERQAEEKKDKHRYYIIGELVVEFFPEVLRFEPGTKAENDVEFQPFKTFLSVLATDSGLMARLKDEAVCRLLLKNQDC